MDALIEDTIETLSSVRSTASQRTTQLIALERNLASLVKGKTSEAEFEMTVRSLGRRFEILSSVLLAHLRSFVKPGDIPKESTTEISITLSVLQGVSLLNAECKRGISTKAAIEMLLELLMLSVLRTQSEDMALVAADVLDALLCVIAGSTAAIRVLEHLKGLECIVRVLRRKGVDPAVRVKSLEVLYFYLLPEKSSSSSSSAETSNDVNINTDSLQPMQQPINKAIKNLESVPYSPKSPLKKHKSSYSIDTARRPSSRLRYISYTDSGSEGRSSGSGDLGGSRRMVAPSHTRSQSDLRSNAGIAPDENVPPVPPIPSQSQQTQHAIPLPKTPEKKRVVPSSRMGTPSQTPRTPRVNGQVRIPPASAPDNTRSVDEKKAILSNWLGNVDALVRGMREAGVWRQ